jgi:pyocin large subunit-like protein
MSMMLIATAIFQDCATKVAVMPNNRTNNQSNNRSRRGGRQKWAAFLPILVAVVGYASRHNFGAQSHRTSSSATQNKAPAPITFAQRSGSSSKGTSEISVAPPAQAAPNQKASASQSNSANVDANVDYSIGFANRSKYEQHFIKHGGEFPGVSKEQYLRMAQEMRDAPLSDSLIESPQARGNLSRFDRTTGAFLAFANDKTIFTFFRPNDGEAYFKRAAKRKV